MTPLRLHRAAGVLTAAAVLAVPGWGVRPARADRPAQASKADLTPENFARLRATVGPQGNEWRHLKVRWHTDIVAARKKAAAEDKPILVFRTGGAGYNDPLGQC